MRSLLRQDHGSLSSVEKVLTSLAELELYEFACPYVVAIACKMRARMGYQPSQSYQSALPYFLAFYRECFEEVCEHLDAYHSDFRDISFQFGTAKDTFLKQRRLHAHCLEPQSPPEHSIESFCESDGDG